MSSATRKGLLGGLWSRVFGSAGKSEFPTVFHITHHKAGSQWINRIFHALAYDRVVLPEVDVAHFLTKPIESGRIYPTLYLTRQQFDSVPTPRNSRRFVIVRDLRDTLVSAYFSFRNSHPFTNEYYNALRKSLTELGQEDGLIHLTETWLAKPAQVQWSWVSASETLLRYEELLQRDEEMLESLLLGHCRLPFTRERLREVVRANRFEARSGRKPGNEDVMSHERKGIAGDWRNHFTSKVTKEFKARYGSILVATGYERDFRGETSSRTRS